MDNLWGNLLLELGFLVLLGILYYFYQRRKILHHEANKGPMLMGYVLHSCLSERGEEAHPELDPVIEAIDDYLHNRAATPPTVVLQTYANSAACSPELRAVIEEALKELE